jgi:hypothetical protein
MEPNGLVVLTIGLCSFAVVCVAAAHFGIKAWRLAKRGLRISKVVIPLAEDLARKSEALVRVSYDLGLNGDQIAINLEKLDASMHRLQVVLQAFNDSLAPYRKVRDYLGM